MPQATAPTSTEAPRPLPAATSGFARLLAAVVWLGALLVGGYHLGLEWMTIGLTEPMGVWETTYVAIARAWPDNYQWSHYLAGHDGYGPGYPLFVRPFLHIGLDIYAAHRLANLVALVLACALVARLLVRAGCPPRVVAAITAIVYALNAGTYSLQARPDFLLLLETTALFTIGAAVVRHELSLGWRSGVLLGLVALAGAFTKAYAVFTWGAVLAYLAVFVNFRDAFRAALTGAMILAAGIAAYASANPLYFMEVFQGPLVQAAPSWDWLLHQTADFGWLSLGLVLAAVLPLPFLLASRARRKRDPLPAPSVHPEANYWLTQALLAAGCLVAGPGWHTGAYLTYFLHWLLVPLAMIAGGHATKASLPSKRWFDLALLANSAVLMLSAPAWPQTDPGWEALRQDVLNAKGRVAVDYIMEPLQRARPDITVVGTGNTGYFLREPFLISRETAVVRQARVAATAYAEEQSRALFQEQAVDTIYLDCLLLTSPQAGPGRFATIPRNELPFFTGPEMQNYVATEIFHIRPYYFATNARREEAGRAKTAIVKFVRKK